MEFGEIIFLNEIQNINHSDLPKVIRVIGYLNYIDFKSNVFQISYKNSTLLIDGKLILLSHEMNQLISFIGKLECVSIVDVMDILISIHSPLTLNEIIELYPPKSIIILRATLVIPSSQNLDLHVYEKAVLKRREFLKQYKE